MFRRTVDRVTLLLEWISIACFIVTVLLVVVAVCLRPLHIAAPWSDEGACLLFIWTSFLSAGVALKRNLHIRIDVLLVKLPPLAVIELKNPSDETADVWAAFNQLQTYKEDISDLFMTN